MPILEEYQNYNVSARTKGNIRDTIKKFTEIRLPPNHLESQTLAHLDEMLHALTFDRSDEQKAMGIIAGSYPSFIGNVT